MEQDALSDAVVAAGQYIESTGKEGLFESFTPDEFDELVRAAVSGYVEGMQRRASDAAAKDRALLGVEEDDIPF